MKFSLITSTLGEDRHNKIVRLIHSLIKQKHQDFELIIVDQNETSKLKVTLESYFNEINLIYLKHDQRGYQRGGILDLGMYLVKLSVFLMTIAGIQIYF